MTSIHNASVASGATTDAITVLPLEPHGLNTQVLCKVYAVNGAALHEIADSLNGASLIFYPTTDSIKITNCDTRAGIIQVTAK